jgi:tryptophan synthase alpha chain
MNRIDEVFRNLKGKRPVRIIYLTSGYPDLATTEKTVVQLEKAGTDIIELGIPFSDPIADGPVIQRTSWLALQNGYSMDDHLDLVKRLRKKTGIPIAMMTYANLMANSGYESIISRAARAGLDGFIIPDLPLEEAVIFSRLCTRSGLINVGFASETSSLERLRKITRLATGFIYAVSQPAVTGGKIRIRKELIELSRTLRKMTSKPVAVGFGISERKDIRRLASYFDGAIIGSAFLKRMLDAGGRPGNAIRFVKGLFA